MHMCSLLAPQIYACAISPVFSLLAPCVRELHFVVCWCGDIEQQAMFLVNHKKKIHSAFSYITIISVVLHPFSNNGCFLLNLEQMI